MSSGSCSGSLTLYLLRHGETAFSKEGTFCGALDPELTEVGLEMARQFALTHADIAWSGIYASPMTRTQQTLAPLCQKLGVEPKLRDGLKEIEFGLWEGLTTPVVAERFAREYQAWLTEPAWNAPPGGERASDVAERALSVVREILESSAEGNVLIVSHKATIRLLLCSLLGIELGRYRDRLDAPAGSVARVRLDAHGPMLLALGDRSYLSDELRQLTGT